MKIKPISRSFGSSGQQSAEHHRDRLIYLIDEFVVMSNNIDSSFRVTTSSGVTNMSKCIMLYDKLKNNSDDRSARICNLLIRLMKIIG